MTIKPSNSIADTAQRLNKISDDTHKLADTRLQQLARLKEAYETAATAMAGLPPELAVEVWTAKKGIQESIPMKALGLRGGGMASIQSFDLKWNRKTGSADARLFFYSDQYMTLDHVSVAADTLFALARDHKTILDALVECVGQVDKNLTQMLQAQRGSLGLTG